MIFFVIINNEISIFKNLSFLNLETFYSEMNHQKLMNFQYIIENTFSYSVIQYFTIPIFHKLFREFQNISCEIILKILFFRKYEILIYVGLHLGLHIIVIYDVSCLKISFVTFFIFRCNISLFSIISMLNVWAYLKHKLTVKKIKNQCRLLKTYLSMIYDDYLKFSYAIFSAGSINLSNSKCM